MHIKDFDGFRLDAAAVDLHSLSKQNIRLPYSGPLPDALQDNDGAALSVMFRAGLAVSVCLEVNAGKGKHRYPVECTAGEVNDLLFSLFTVDAGNNSFPLTRDCGLSPYWRGFHQNAYINWRRVVFEGYGLDDLIRQLSPDAFERAGRYMANARKTA